LSDQAQTGVGTIEPPKPGDALVWWMEVSSPPADLIANWRGCLDMAEQARADAFRFDVDRVSYIAAHWLLRAALASVGGRAAADWRFCADRLGKPRLDPDHGPPGLTFNLSHARGLVGCAIGIGDGMGIDVETFEPGRADLSIAPSCFSAAETALLQATPPELQPVQFFRLWTLKEAFVKATGQGLSRALDSFSFSLDPVSIDFPPGASEQPGQWQFIERRPLGRHFLALAIHRAAAAPVALKVYPMRPW
jgi:4'-phosphopantetheinyl transferase